MTDFLQGWFHAYTHKSSHTSKHKSHTSTNRSAALAAASPVMIYYVLHQLCRVSYSTLIDLQPAIFPTIH